MRRTPASGQGPGQWTHARTERARIAAAWETGFDIRNLKVALPRLPEPARGQAEADNIVFGALEGRIEGLSVCQGRYGCSDCGLA